MGRLRIRFVWNVLLCVFLGSSLIVGNAIAAPVIVSGITSETVSNSKDSTSTSTSTPKTTSIDEAKKVVMFSATYCPACRHAKSFFKEHNIAFMEFDIEKSVSARGYFDRLGGRGTPLLLINNHRMTGFSESRFWNYYGLTDASSE